MMVLLVCFLVFGIVGFAFGYTEGLDEKIGTAGIVYENEIGSWNENYEWQEDYGLTLQPIRVNPQTGTILMPRLRIQKGDIGISLGEFSAKGSNTVSDSVPGRDYQRSWEDSSYTDEFSIGIVEIWDEPFYGYYQNEDYTYDSEAGRTSYCASRNFNLDSQFVQFDAPVTKHLRGVAGFRKLNWTISDSQGVNGIFHFPYYYSDYWEYHDGSWEYWQVTGIYEDKWNLSANSKVDLTASGLELGLAGNWPIARRLSIGAEFSKSWLSGKTKESGMFLDVDNGSDQWEEYYQYYDAYYDEYYESSWNGENGWTMTGKIPLSARHSSSVDMIEVGLNLSYAITSRLSLGVGYAKVILKGLPLPAKFHYVGWAEEGNPFWETGRTTDISQDGYRVVLSYSF